MTTAERKRKTDEARKLEDELKKYQILGVGKRWLSREEAEKFSDLGGPQIMAQNHKRPTVLSDYKKHKVENTFLDEKNIDTRREIPIQKVANKEIGELSQGTTTESSAIKKSFVEDDPNERTENTELVMVTTSDNASGSTSEPAPFPYGTELRSSNQNQDETYSDLQHRCRLERVDEALRQRFRCCCSRGRFHMFSLCRGFFPSHMREQQRLAH